MKNLFKYVFMLMVVAMGAVVISSCGGDDDDDSGSGSGTAAAAAGTMVIDGTSYTIDVVEPSSKGYKIDFVCTSKNVGIQIKTMDKSVFPTTAGTVSCEVEAWIGSTESEAENVSVLCCHPSGTNYKFIINNANINGHTVSLTFDDDASKYTEN